MGIPWPVSVDIPAIIWMTEKLIRSTTSNSKIIIIVIIIIVVI